nr:MAG TPA: hypothetical protein [Caudoviricetes sp.]
MGNLAGSGFRCVHIHTVPPPEFPKRFRGNLFFIGAPHVLMELRKSRNRKIIQFPVVTR